MFTEPCHCPVCIYGPPETVGLQFAGTRGRTGSADDAGCSAGCGRGSASTPGIALFRFLALCWRFISGQWQFKRTNAPRRPPPGKRLPGRYRVTGLPDMPVPEFAKPLEYSYLAQTRARTDVTIPCREGIVDDLIEEEYDGVPVTASTRTCSYDSLIVRRCTQ